VGEDPFVPFRRTGSDSSSLCVRVSESGLGLMPRGPLPDPKHHRRNAPTIPTTNLPAGGRQGPAPRIPKGSVELGAAGRAWWRWAWSTPQAAAWDAGSFQVVLRRARLEDAVALLEEFDLGEPPSDPAEVPEYLETLKWVIQVLKGAATGVLGVMREMRELDDRLGLTPKAMAQLRWSIVAEEEPERVAVEVVDRLAERRRRLASA
jgi:hypothetical protein